MEEEYNWKLILSVAVPVSAISGYVNYSNFSDSLKFWTLIIGTIISALIVYFINRKKSNIFTAAAVVFLAVLAIKLLRSSGLV